MKSLSRILSATGLAVGLALMAVPADAQQKKAPAAAPALKPGSPAAIAAAKEILAMKNASAMYASAVPNLVEQTKNVLMQSNLNYQKDLNEVAVIVAKNLAGREKDFDADIANALSYSKATGCKLIHVMAGLVHQGARRDVFVLNLKKAARKAAGAGANLVIEPINRRDIPGYFLN